jgi:hypothetical protein
VLVVYIGSLPTNNDGDFFALIVLRVLCEAHPEILLSVKFQFIEGHWLSNLSRRGGGECACEKAERQVGGIREVHSVIKSL